MIIKPSITPPKTELLIQEGLFAEDFFITHFDQLKRKFLICDETIRELYGNDLAKKISAELIVIPAGEKAKNQTTVTFLLNELFKKQANRKTTLIALGGGVTTDLVGFVASIYLRGVPLILLPTTLLAMVDASIGGKTSIDSPFGKNLIGSFYHPKAIFSDLHCLKTLPEKEWLNGYAEILKMALIYDDSIWKLAKKNKNDPSLIFKAIQGKISIIEKDPLELGLRRILNFGHTIGHALEKISDYEISHGEAVVMGTIGESYLSFALGYLSKEEFEEILSLYQIFPLKISKKFSREAFFQALGQDKKRSDKSRFVLIEKIGQAMSFGGSYCKEIPHDLIESTLNWLENYAK